MKFVKQLELLTQAQTPEERANAEFYILEPFCYMRAYRDIPFCIMDAKRGDTLRLSELELSAAKICNGRIDVNCFAVTPSMRRAVQNLCRLGYAKRCEYGAKLSEEQHFRSYDIPFRPSLKWAITGRCNMKCKHCFLSAPEAKFGELSHEECMRIIEELPNAGIYRVVLTGGEPLVRPDFFELVDAMLTRDIKVTSIATNGLLINERFIGKLLDRGIKPAIFMSYDGTDGWHDWLRGMDGAEKMLLSKFELLAKHGFYTGSAMTIHNLNKGVLRESVNRLASVGAKQVIMNRMTSFGEWKKYGQDFNITMQELYEAFFAYLPYFYEDGMPVKLVMNRLYKSDAPGSPDYSIPYVKQCVTCKEAVCRSAQINPYIAADGSLMPCLPIASQEVPCLHMPNVKDGLIAALNDPAYYTAVDRTLEEYYQANPECRACKYAKDCMGGCRANALQSDPNNYLTKDMEACMFFHNEYPRRLMELIKSVAPEAKCLNYSPEKSRNMLEG